MSSATGPPSEDKPPEYRVADPEEFNQTERLRTINDVRKRAGEAIQVTMTQLRTEDSFEVSDRQQILRAAIYRYLTEIEWLAHEAEDAKLLNDTSFGKVTLQPPDYLQQLVNGNPDQYPRPIGSPDLKPWTYEINGINGYLTAPEVFQSSWTVQVETRHGGPQPIQEVQATYMPAHISLNAYRMANRFLSKNGIDVELAESEHRAVVDKELLEQIESWRKKSIQDDDQLVTDGGVDVQPAADVNAGPASLWAKYPSLANSKLFDEYANRLVVGRDMHVIITASSETGVGKTTLAVVLALLWDQHGWTPDKAAVASAPEYAVKYDDEEEVKEGSVLILDEAEIAADARRGTSKGNVDVSHAFAGKRYRQVFGMMTAPSKNWVDQRLGSDAADYWIQTQETDRGRPKGEAIVYRLRSNEHYQTDYTKRHEIIDWPILDDHPAFRELGRRKKERLGGQYSSPYVHRDEVEDMKSNWWNKATLKARYHIVKAMVRHGLTQTETAEILQEAEHVDGLSQSQVSRLMNSELFEEFYSR